MHRILPSEPPWAVALKDQRRNVRYCWAARLVGNVEAIASITGRGAAWLARLTGGQKVAGSNPVAPILFRYEPFDTPLSKGFFLWWSVLESRWHTVQISRSGGWVFCGSLM